MSRNLTFSAASRMLTEMVKTKENSRNDLPGDGGSVVDHSAEENQKREQQIQEIPADGGNGNDHPREENFCNQLFVMDQAAATERDGGAEEDPKGKSTEREKPIGNRVVWRDKAGKDDCNDDRTR